MERSTVAPLGRWPRLERVNVGLPLWGLGVTELAGIALSSLRQTKQDKTF